jgi:hypothetical protein
MRSPIPSHRNRRCDGVTRRDVLHLGVLSCLGMSLADFLRMEAAAAEAEPGAQHPVPGGRNSGTGHRAPGTVSCILIWLDGGPSHLDTFDLKPEAPVEVRGEFNPIRTNVSGVRICEHLPLTAQVMDKVALIRSLTHELGNHDTGSHYLLTGHRPTPAVEYPSLGSVVARETGFRRALPPYIAIPEAVHSARSGYLPDSYSPFSVGGDLSRPNYQVRDLQPPDGLQLERIDRRRAMVKALDRFSRTMEESSATQSRDSFYEQAYRLITSPEAKAAFDLSRETAETRQQYGHHRLGTSCLLARRLVEVGARFVTVVDSGWDHHTQIFKALPDAFFPGSGKLTALDQGYSALVTDLHQRGLLESTLVVLMGEFGRTPKINSAGGRDHWPRAGSVCLAGGGIKGGQVIGATDSCGEVPSDRPVRPEDLAFSVLTLLGIDPRKEYQTPEGRPIKLLADGALVAELL